LKWGLARFRETRFTEIIKILLRHQKVDRCPLSAYLRRWLFYNQSWSQKIYKEQDVKHGLATLTTVLLENLQYNIRFLLPFEDLDSLQIRLSNFWPPLCSISAVSMWVCTIDFSPLLSVRALFTTSTTTRTIQVIVNSYLLGSSGTNFQKGGRNVHLLSLPFALAVLLQALGRTRRLGQRFLVLVYDCPFPCHFFLVIFLSSSRY
jgi:hypothetical protein